MSLYTSVVVIVVLGGCSAENSDPAAVLSSFILKSSDFELLHIAGA